MNLPGNHIINDPLGGNFQTIGSIISGLFPWIFALAGLGLLFYFIMGGFELLTSGGNPETINRGKGKITHALIGFIIIFVSFWLIQLLEVVLGIQIWD